LLATIPATPRQRRRTLGAVAALLVAFGAAAPFAAIRLWESDGFIPAVQTVIVVTDLITAVLLFTQFTLIRSRSLLALACTYLFTALITFVHILTFPRAFAPEGLLGAGPQTAGWLYLVAHFAFPAAVVAYALLDEGTGSTNKIRHSSRTIICCSVIGIVALVAAISWALIAADELLPPLFVDRRRYTPIVFFACAVELVVGVIAMALLVAVRRSVLDQWLSISVAAAIVELAMVTFFSGSRFDVGWYAIRIFSVVSSISVLLGLLTETTRLYAKLSNAVRGLQRERDNKLLSVRAATAAIAHEVRQPLTAIAANGGAGLLFLQATPPNLAEVRESFELIVDDCQRASQTIETIRSFFHNADQAGQPVDINQIIAEVMVSRQEQAAHGGVEVRTDLVSGLPLVRGHKGQLQEVVINLVNNAFEALDSSPPRDRLLRVNTALQTPDKVAVRIQDSGPGIHPERIGSLFETIATTKPNGMGLGLTISRMIIENHGGKLTVASDGRSGAVFEFVLPVADDGRAGLSAV
jgi:signal transduction histidine kinase